MGEHSARWYASGSPPMLRRLWAGPKLMGRALREWLGIPTLRTGRMTPEAAGADGHEVYLFKESDELHQFGLRRRSGEGCCCNVVVGDLAAGRAVAWSRFVGASTFCSNPR